MTEILQILIYGLVLGCILAIGAAGVSLIFGILRFAHFAHGDLMTFGAYSVFLFHVQVGAPWGLSLALGIPLTVALAIAMDRLFYRRLRQRSPVILLISSFASALMIRAIILLIWGPDIRVYDTSITPVWRYAGLRIDPDHIQIVAFSAITALTLSLFLRYHRLGKAMRAVADNPPLAQLCAIPTETVIVTTWVLGTTLAAVAGITVATDSHIQPELGWHLLLPIFAAAILGGIGNPYGALFGGLVIGISTELSTLVIPPAYKAAVSFGIIIVCLIFRPRGLFPAPSSS